MRRQDAFKKIKSIEKIQEGKSKTDRMKADEKRFPKKGKK